MIMTVFNIHISLERMIKKYGICKKICAGYFEKLTKVKVIGKSYRGYDLEDEYGNRIIETGYNSIG